MTTCSECGADVSREGHRFHCPEFVSLTERMEKLAAGAEPSNFVADSERELAEGLRKAGLIALTTKPSNPKDAVGIKKAPLSTLSAPVLAEVGIAMLEGARKYGRHNFRVIGVRASVYYDATLRHMMQWWEGEDVDADSGLSHVTKAIASLVVLRDAMMQQKFVDDRPPVSRPWIEELNKRAAHLLDKYPDAKPAHLATDGQ